MYDKKETPTKIIVGVSFLLKHLAEATRFELVVRLPVRQFSKLVVSATHPNFHTSLLRVQI